MYMVGLAVGPMRPVVPTLGLKAVAPAGLLVARRQRAELAAKEIGRVTPGTAWMLVSSVGRVNVMVTKALGRPTSSHSPPLAALGETVVDTPRTTDPKSRSRRVVMVIPTVTTTASPVMAPEDWPCAGTAPAARAAAANTNKRGVTVPEPRPSPEPA